MPSSRKPKMQMRLALVLCWSVLLLVLGGLLQGCGHSDGPEPPLQTTTSAAHHDILHPSTTATATTPATATPSPMTTAATTTTTSTSTSTMFLSTSTTDAPVGSSGLLDSFRNCYLAAPLKLGNGCENLRVLEGAEFGLNEFGQETTGKRICLDKLRQFDGDTFVFEVGRCELWRCQVKSALHASVVPAPATASVAAEDASVVSFLSARGKYLAVGSGDLLRADAGSDGPPTAFRLRFQEDGKVTLQHESTGLYASAEPSGAVVVNRPSADLWEIFDLVHGNDGTVSIKSWQGFYVTAYPSGEAFANGLENGPWQAMRLVNKSSFAAEGNAFDDTEAVAVNTNASIYSNLCEFQEGLGGRGGQERRAPIIVKLWEWNFVDVARECREYLGPNGFDAVQISPVTEHVRGAQWWTKYQPVSFGLNSRSGTAEQFQRMVSECRAAGVQVLVDLILNHVGSACPVTNGSPSDPAPCVGWNGSMYGYRRLEGSRGWDAAGQDMFHHAADNLGAGECNVGPPTFLCGSLVTTDCSCCNCDMYGLPDWDTSRQDVLDIHFKHVKELHDMGVTMLRIDAALYEDVGQTSRVLNRFPWDYVYMEWWGEYPVGIHDKYLGNYRDVALRWKICDALAVEKDLSKLPQLLALTHGVFGLDPEKSLYPMAYHDKRTDEAVQSIATYKNGLEYHQQQKFMLAWPKTVRISIWGGFGWTHNDQGPPGCELGQDTCNPAPVFDEVGLPNCLSTPSQSPLPDEEANRRSWVCEHRWTGVAGLVGFRKACRGFPITQVPSDGLGRLAFRIGDECLVALVRGTNSRWPQGFGHLGDWQLVGLETGLPAGRYCDVAALSSRFSEERGCPREVVIGDNGIVVQGTALEGDLLAIYTGARLTRSNGDVSPPHRRLRIAK